MPLRIRPRVFVSVTVISLICAIALILPPASPPTVAYPTTPAKTWPWAEESVHPLVRRIPPTAETSLESFADYIVGREPDPFLQVKALHDYVATRIDYDFSAYKRGHYPPQDARTVFATRKAVCSGFARLLKALGEAVGIEMAYIPGDFRNPAGDLSGEGHAWNAAKIDGNWYLIDVTWNSGYLTPSRFISRYRTAYLFTPPDVMAMTHFPRDRKWQLLSRPLHRPEFTRQPLLDPNFFALGFELIAPKWLPAGVRNSAEIWLKNRDRRWVLAEVIPPGGPASRCAPPTTRETPEISCPVTRRGTHTVRLYGSDRRDGDYQYLGAFQFEK